MNTMMYNCGNCIHRQDNGYCKWETNAKKYSDDYCVWWKAKTPENNFETTTTDDDLFTMIKDLQKVNLKLTERIQKLEDKVGKLEESVEVLDAREKPKQNKTIFDDECKECPEFDEHTGWCNINGNCYLVENPKQEKWIVHRTLRTKGREAYINSYKKKHNQYTTLYEKQFAKKYTEEEAISIRDELNRKRIGKRYLWVISKEL